MKAEGSVSDRGHEAGSPRQMPAAAWRDIVSRTWQRSWEDNIGLVAAGVAFYGFFALVPLLGMTVLAYGLFADAGTVVQNVRALTAILPDDIAELIGELLMNAVLSSTGTKGAGIAVALLVALYGGTNGAGAIITALDISYEEKEKRSLLRFYSTALAMTCAAVLLALAALGAVTAVAMLGDILEGVPPPIVLLGKILSYAALALGAAALISALYRYAPSREQARWRWITPGSGLAAICWVLLTGLFGFYTTQVADFDKAYGSIGAVVALLTWIYFSAYVLLVGAELNSEIEHQTAVDSTTGPPEPMGRRGAWAADHVAQDAEVRDRPEEAREGQRLTEATPPPPENG